MNNDDLVKKIGDIVDEKINKAIKPIKQTLNTVTKQLGDPKTGLKSINNRLDGITTRLDDPKTGLGRLNGRFDILWEQTVSLTEDMTEVKETLESHSASLKRLETNTEHSRDNVHRVDKRVSTIEAQLGISPPPELVIIK